MPVTVTNAKHYVAVCDWCGATSNVYGTSGEADALLDTHLWTFHKIRRVTKLVTGERTAGMAIKQPTEDLPEQEGGIKLGDYVDKLCVFDNGHEQKGRESAFGKRDVVLADLYVFDKSDDNANEHGWVAVGEVIVWFVTVGKQIMGELPDQLAGILTHGTDRNVNEWAITPVPKSAKNMLAALDTWTNSF